MATRSDCLTLLDDVETMLAGGWSLAAAGFAWAIFRHLTAVLLADRGPSPGLAAWLEDEARALPSTAEAARELRATLQAADLIPAVIAAHDLARLTRAGATTTSHELPGIRA